MRDVWFGRDANYSKTQSTPNDSYSSIDWKKTQMNLVSKYFQIFLTGQLGLCRSNNIDFRKSAWLSDFFSQYTWSVLKSSNFELEKNWTSQKKSSENKHPTDNIYLVFSAITLWISFSLLSMRLSDMVNKGIEIFCKAPMIFL